MFSHGSCGTDCLWCTVCKRGKRSFISWHAVPCVQSCSSHSYFLRLHCYINWSFDPERDWNNEWKTQPNDKTAARIRPKKKFCLVPVSDRPCQFMCDPNYFMSLIRLWDGSTPTPFLQFSPSFSLQSLSPPLPFAASNFRHRLWVCVRFIVQLVLTRQELARFIDTRRACERSRARSKRNIVRAQNGF